MKLSSLLLENSNVNNSFKETAKIKCKQEKRQSERRKERRWYIHIRTCKYMAHTQPYSCCFCWYKYSENVLQRSWNQQYMYTHKLLKLVLFLTLTQQCNAIFSLSLSVKETAKIKCKQGKRQSESIKERRWYIHMRTCKYMAHTQPYSCCLV